MCLYEVTKWTLREEGEEAADEVEERMLFSKTIDLNPHLARAAAVCALRYRLPAADSIIYATPQRYDAELWTQDDHFEGLPGVRYFEKVAV